MELARNIFSFRFDGDNPSTARVVTDYKRHYTELSCNTSLFKVRHLEARRRGEKIVLRCASYSEPLTKYC
jgi:predicted SprT family Zn-dependent metalloprotease